MSVERKLTVGGKSAELRIGCLGFSSQSFLVLYCDVTLTSIPRHEETLMPLQSYVSNRLRGYKESMMHLLVSPTGEEEPAAGGEIQAMSRIQWKQGFRVRGN